MMNPRLKQSCALIMSAWCVSILGIQSVSAQTLSAVLESARTHDPTFRAAEFAVEAAKQEVSYAESALGPKVTFSANRFTTDRVEESTVLGRVNRQERNFESELYQIQARQPIYRHRDRVTIKQAEAEFESVQYTFRQAEQDLAARSLEAWLNVLVARDIERAYQHVKLNAQELVLEAEKKLKAGEIGLQDLLQSKTDALQSEALHAESRAQLDVENQRLRLIAGSEAFVGSQYRLADPLRFPFVVLTEVQLAEQLESLNFEILASRLKENSAQLERDKVAADRYPTLDAYASTSKGDNDANSAIKDEQRLGVSLSVPLYTHGAISSAVAQADANYRKAMQQTRAVAFRVRAEAWAAQLGLQTALAKMSAADQAVSSAESLVKARELGLKAGVYSRGELAQARQELMGAIRQKALSRKDYAVTWLRLQRALSALTPATITAFEAQAAVVGK